MENAKRLENLSWRLWYHESFQQQHNQQQQVTPILSKPVPTSTIPSSLSSHSTFGPQTPLEPIHHHHHYPAEQQRQEDDTQHTQSRRMHKFYVDESDQENDDDDEDEQDESMWSTLRDDHYLEEAYQQPNPTPCLPPQGLPDKALPSPLPALTNHKPSCSLLSRLIQSSPQPPSSTINHQSAPYDLLPPQLQSCVDWEKAQNSIPYRLGYSLELPDEDIIW
jgi:hypothetical protein